MGTMQQVFECKESDLYEDYNRMNNLCSYGKANVPDAERVLLENLSFCGREAKVSFYCKECEKSGNEALLKVSKRPFYCEIRYCDNPECKSYLFAQQLAKLQRVKRFLGLKKLGHFVIGFPKIHIDDFRANFSKYKKRYEYVMNTFFKRLKKAGFPIHAYRAMDFSFVDDNHVFPHYHFACLPFPMGKMRAYLSTMQSIRSAMISKQRVSMPFHLQFFKNANRTGIESYIALRGVGLYKHETTDKTDYQIPKRGNLIVNIHKKKYFMLKDVVDEATYLKHFYKKRMFVSVGEVSLPYGSTSTDNVVLKCSTHGTMEASDRSAVRIERIFTLQVVPPPPDSEVSTFEIIKIGN